MKIRSAGPALIFYSLLKQNIKSCNAKRRQRERRKKGLTACAAHVFCTFLCRWFARLQRETSRNFLLTCFMEEMSYVFLFTFLYLLPLIFTLFGALPTKKCLLCLLFLAPALCRSFYRWASLVCRLLSLFLFFSLSLYYKFVDKTINLSLILYTTRIQKQFPLSVFVFIDTLVVSASQDEGGHAISRQNNLELHLG